MSTLHEIVADFFRHHELIASTGIMAVSGGPDSVCLACILRGLQLDGAISKLTLAHVNHQLRGAESDADEAFVEALALRWGLSCRTIRIDVAAKAHHSGENLEQTARTLRYNWLTEVAREENATWVATGHSADDQAETVLFRLLRGSGLQGLCGMAPRRELAPRVALIRPLLEVRRSSILAFLTESGLPYREDSTNLDLHLSRNRLRHELLPQLAREYNPGITDILCRLAVQAREAQADVDQRVGALLAQAELPRAGSMVVLATKPLLGASPHLRCEVLRAIWRREGWPMGQMAHETWDRLGQLVESDMGAVDLPGGVHAKRVGKVLQLIHQPGA